MYGRRYPAQVKTIHEIRMENYARLLEELAGQLGPEPKGVKVAEALGISAAYVSQIKKGKRKQIEDRAARIMEAKRGKDRGWMDNDPALWPFETVSFDRFDKLPERFKGMAEQELKRVLEEWESSRPALGGGPGEKAA